MKKIFRISMVLLLGAVVFSCTKEEFIPTDDLSNDLLKSAKVSQGYIVVFEDQDLAEDALNVRQSKVASHARGLMKKAGVEGAEITRTYGKAIQGVAVKLPPGQVKKLENLSGVKYIEKDKLISLAPPPGKGKDKTDPEPAAQTTPWGISRVNGGVASSATAWIIDSGIDLDHPDLNVDVNRSAVFIDGKRVSPDDQFGHGTHVAGTVAAIDNNQGVIGVAAGANVVSVRVLDRRGSGYLSWVIAGVDYVAANGSSGDVANMSLGGGVSTAIDDAVYNASQTGIKFVLAAGNESDNADSHSPARVNGPNIYTISAMDINDNWAYFSNYGDAVDYCAPGYSIYSTYKGGAYETMSGTSMAAPHVAGILLLGNISTDGTVNGDPDGNADPIAVH